MRVLHVVASMNPILGGVVKAIQILEIGLSKYKILNEVVTLDSPDATYLKYNAFAIHALGPSKSPWSYSNKLLPWLMESIYKYDAIIIHGLWLYPSYAVNKVIQLYKNNKSLLPDKDKTIPKLFVMPHGMLDPYFQQADGRKWKALRNQLYWKLIECRVINSAHGLLFTCEEEKQLAKLPFKPYHPKQEIVIGLGTEEPPKYTLAMKQVFLLKCSVQPNQPYILFLSRIHQKKGVELLINAYAKLYKGVKTAETFNKHGNTTLVDAALPILIIAGPGLESDYGQQIQKTVVENKLLKNAVYFTGMLTGDAKWGAFYGCDAFILPSHQENFGIAVVEAMACQKPVLISNKINIWREIETAGGGIATNPTQEGVENLLSSWMNLGQKAKTDMGVNARSLFENTFAVNKVADKLMHVLG